MHPQTGQTQAPGSRAQQDQNLEYAIATLLRIGVTAAAVLVLAGGVLALRHSGTPAPDYRTFHSPDSGQSPAISSIGGIFTHLLDGSGAAVIGVGLLVLIATPILRVIFAAAGFARERDWLYTAISLLVFAILAYSLLHGR